ncbi:hypothetical protein ACTU44_19520 [Thalassospira sp. SM2505]
MVERAILSQSIVDCVRVPQVGEKWIADTKVQGFGLRVWRKADGSEGKAFCVRASDQLGKSHRRTLDVTSRFEWRLATWKSSRSTTEKLPSLGLFVEAARDWARDTVDEIKGRPTLADEEKIQRQAYQSSARKRTVRRLAEVILRGYSVNGASQSYIDRLDKLFFGHVPAKLLDQPVSSLTEQDISMLSNFKVVSPGNLKFLRPFIGRIFELDSRLSNTRNLYYQLRRSATINDEDQNSEQQILANWDDAKISQLFDFLLAEKQYWQQATCLYFYFSFSRAPLSQLMAARWNQFYEFKNRTADSQDSESSGRIAWCYRDAAWHHESVSIRDLAVLSDIRAASLSNSRDNEYLFPSPFGEKVKHIRSVDHVWIRTLERFQFSYVSPRQFKLMLSESHSYRFRRLRDLRNF